MESDLCRYRKHQYRKTGPSTIIFHLVVRNASLLCPDHWAIGRVREDRETVNGYCCHSSTFHVSILRTRHHAEIPSYYAFYSIAWTPLPIMYTTEILPFELRTKGLALFTAVGTASNAFNQFVNPVALKALQWR